MGQEHREYEGLPGPSNRGIIVDKSNAKETYPLRWTSVMDQLSLGNSTEQVHTVKDQTRKNLLVLDE